MHMTKDVSLIKIECLIMFSKTALQETAFPILHGERLCDSYLLYIPNFLFSYGLSCLKVFCCVSIIIIRHVLSGIFKKVKILVMFVLT